MQFLIEAGVAVTLVIALSWRRADFDFLSLSRTGETGPRIPDAPVSSFPRPLGAFRARVDRSPRTAGCGGGFRATSALEDTHTRSVANAAAFCRTAISVSDPLVLVCQSQTKTARSPAIVTETKGPGQFAQALDGHLPSPTAIVWIPVSTRWSGPFLVPSGNGSPRGPPHNAAGTLGGRGCPDIQANRCFATFFPQIGRSDMAIHPNCDSNK